LAEATVAEVMVVVVRVEKSVGGVEEVVGVGVAVAVGVGVVVAVAVAVAVSVGVGVAVVRGGGSPHLIGPAAGVAIEEEQHTQLALAIGRPQSASQLLDKVTRPLPEDTALHRAIPCDEHANAARVGAIRRENATCLSGREA